MRLRKDLCGAAAVLVAVGLWLPTLRFFFRGPSDADQRTALVNRLATRQITYFAPTSRDSAETQTMRRTNPEWDFMGRTFTVMALANLALANRSRHREYLTTIDRIIADTLTWEKARGQDYFMLSYAKGERYLHSDGRSLFVDGEVALMIGARQLVKRSPHLESELRSRVALIVEQFENAPHAFPESYPNEAWAFCNSAALAAVRIADHLHGEDHRPLFDRWATEAKGRLIDPKSGLIASRFTADGKVLDGPEGSSLWTTAHFLRFVDDDFAQDQYVRARRSLGREILGFGYATEWPHPAPGRVDVDSGPIVPLLGASAGSSRQALVAAAAFGDEDFLASLIASLNFAAFPTNSGGVLRYAAAGQVGDAVLLYALTFGPMLDAVRTGGQS